MFNRRLTLVTALAAAMSSPVFAETIEQKGNLDGGLGSQFHDVLLDRFDPALGQLQSVSLEFLTAVIGGGQTTGSGQPVHIVAELSANYFIGLSQIGATEALVDTVIPNNGAPVSFSVFDNDIDTFEVTEPAALDQWIGAGDLLMRAFTTFAIEEDPPIISFSAGGSVSWSLTYEYAIIDTDINGDGTTDVDDLIEVILNWGDCPALPDPCDADVDGNGSVDVDDLIAVILAWS